MNANNTNPNNVARTACFALIGLALLVIAAGCDTYGFGYGGYDAYGLFSDSLAYRNDVMDWSAQSWSDVILYDDYIPYSTWDAYDLTYPNY